MEHFPTLCDSTHMSASVIPVRVDSQTRTRLHNVHEFHDIEIVTHHTFRFEHKRVTRTSSQLNNTIRVRQELGQVPVSLRNSGPNLIPEILLKSHLFTRHTSLTRDTQKTAYF